MGIDLIRGGRNKNRGHRQTKTTNSYLKTLIKLYSFLNRRTDSRFNKVVLKRLNQSRLNRYPISISRITRILSKDKLIAGPAKQEAGIAEKVGKALSSFVSLFKRQSSKAQIKLNQYNSRIVAVVGTVTNDNRLINVPEGLKVCALKFTQAARNRIEKAQGQCLTFDQLAQIAPTGKGVLLLRGPRDRQAKRHFGLYPGQKGSHTAPRVRCEGRKWERARGRR